MKLCVLASGSSGNCIYIEEKDTRLLIDAGLSLREKETRLRGLGVRAADISAVCLTHEHSDHVRGLAQLQKRHNVPVYANEATAGAIEQLLGLRDVRWTVFPVGATFRVGAFELTSFSIPHDASDTVGYVVDDGRCRLGVATDLGTVPEAVHRVFETCDALVLEANHDIAMLRASRRPWSLIRRILSRHGHLSNEDAAALLGRLSRAGRLKTVFLAHLSEDCNRPEIALREIERTLRDNGPAVPGPVLKMTYRDRISELLDLDG